MATSPGRSASSAARPRLPARFFPPPNPRSVRSLRLPLARPRDRQVDVSRAGVRLRRSRGQESRSPLQSRYTESMPQHTAPSITVPPDPVIEAYKKDIDRGLLRNNLRRTVDERLLELMRMPRFGD